ncbi:MAG: hypothetical protein IJ642_14125 [Oscillospiraceae bacterium]|nr:hypothetical protein [Oscillospiraceae bacterium]MBR1530417.1 hypothetical protein [Oscillospiraceae bacterium]
MKLSRLISGLHNSTKATVIACSVLLAFTAAVLFFLMLFPIKMRDRSAALSAPTVIETTTTDTLPVEIAETTKEPPHTLSTWAASAETLATTFDPDETTDIPWYDKIFTSTVQTETDDYGNVYTVTQTETTTAVYTETQPQIIETPAPTEPVTIPPEPETQPPVQTITEVVVTEPPVTVPPEAEIINADPVAPDFSNE